MSHPTLERHAKARRLQPVYLFFGEEEFLLRRALVRLAELWGQGEPAPRTLADAATTDLSEVLGEARTAGLWANRQVVVLMGTERYKGGELKLLEKYLDNPAQDTCLVLVASGLKGKDVEPHAVWRRLQEKDAALGFFRLKESQLPRWLADEAARVGKTLTPAAARHLIDAVGQDLTDLHQELEKLALYVGHADTIGPEAVADLASRSRSHTIFELVDALGGGRPGHALTVLGRLLELGEPGPKILVMLARQVRLLLKVKEAAPTNPSVPELASRLGVHAMIVEKLQRQAAKFNARQLLQSLETLHRTDRGLKTSAASPRLLLEKAVLELCPPQAVTERGSGR